MGLVYRARRVGLDKAVALKVLRPGIARDPEIAARFRVEAEAASAIGNPHIIDVSDFGTVSESTYYVMELLDGKPLTRALAIDGALEIPRVIHILRQLCDALSAAHAKGIVHRDIKPDNIHLVTRDGDADFVKILDFGIAKILGAAHKLTRPGEVFGSPDYMSPEQCRALAVDGRSDIYSLGVLLFELIMGCRPFAADSYLGYIDAHVNQPPPLLTPYRPDCPLEIQAIVLRCLAKAPADRYQTCAEIVVDLDAYAAGKPVWIPPHVRAILDQPAPAPRAANPVEGAAELQRLRERRRIRANVAAKRAKRRNALGMLFVGVSLVLGAALVFALARATMRSDSHRIVIPAIPTFSFRRAVIRIESEPDGAEMHIDGRLVSRTPTTLPRPVGANRTEIVLRADGYVERRIVLSAATIAPSLHFTLAPVRAARPVQPRVDSPAPPPRPASDPNAPGATDPRRHHATVDEVTDPWN